MEEYIELVDAALLPRARSTLHLSPPLSSAHRFVRELEPYRHEPGSIDDEVYCLKLRGDALRWLAETSHHATANAHGTAQSPWNGATRTPRGCAAAAYRYPRDAEAAYKEALALAKCHLPWDATRLACVNNYAVLLVCVLGRREEGCALASDASEQVALEQVSRARGVEGAAWLDRVAPVIDLLRDNLRTWAEDAERERERERERRLERSRAVDDSIVVYPLYRGQGCRLTLRGSAGRLHYARLEAAGLA